MASKKRAKYARVYLSWDLMAFSAAGSYQYPSGDDHTTQVICAFSVLIFAPNVKPELLLLGQPGVRLLEDGQFQGQYVCTKTCIHARRHNMFLTFDANWGPQKGPPAPWLPPGSIPPLKILKG